jgi:hypothetical protein
MTTLYKMVNGEKVAMSDTEALALQNEWDAASVPQVPKSVTRRQGKAALLLAGKLDLVQPAINAIADTTQRALMQIEWDEALDFDRNRPSLIQMATAIGLDSAALDQLFISAAAL